MNASDAASTLFNTYNDKLNNVAPTAVLIQLGFMAILSVLAVTAFSILRPNNSVVYQPKAKYSEDGKRPPKIDKGFFSWVRPLMSSKEADLIPIIGLDAVTFLRFLRMCRNLFLAVAALTCAALLPLDITYNVSIKNQRNYLLILTIQAVQGAFLWGHVAATYVITLFTFYMVWVNYEKMVQLRWQWFRSLEYQNAFHARSLMITQVSKAYQTDQGVANLLNTLQVPYPTSAVHIGRRVGTLPNAVKEHNNAVRQLEEVLTTYLKNPDSVPEKRPTMKVKESGTVDAIDYLTQKIHRLEQRVHVIRDEIGERKAENYGFASFEAVPFAHIVAKKLHGKKKNGTYFELAPQPNDIIWDNLHMSDGTRSRAQIFGAIILVVFCFFYTIPLLAVSLLANLAALSGFVKFINDWSQNYPLLFSAFIGIVPSLLSLLLQLLLPVVIRWIAAYQGALTHSQSDRYVTARYSAFLLISQFFIFSLLGVIVQIITAVVTDITGKKSAGAIFDYLKSVPSTLQTTWVYQSTYWLTVFPLRGSSAFFDLAQLLQLVYVWFRTRLFGRTPREIREWTKPPEFDYAVYYSNHLFMGAVALVYAPLAPLVPLFAAAAFAVSVWVYKYQLMYVFVTKVETGGRLWNVAINRVLAALVMMQLLMVLTIGLKAGWLKSVATAPPVLSVVIFKILLTKRFDTRFKWFIPSTAEMNDLHLHQADSRKNRLQKRFGHPSLHDPLFTPMLHKSVQHLLPTVYNGRIGTAQGSLEGGKTVEQNTAGGLTFNMLESHDLSFDRLEYLRQRDEDEMTVSSAAVFGGRKGASGGDGYFDEARHKEYMSQAGHSGQNSPSLTMNEYDEHDLSRMHTMASHENLIQYPPHPPRYGSPTPHQKSGAYQQPGQAYRVGHVTQASQASTGSQGYEQQGERYDPPEELNTYGEHPSGGVVYGHQYQPQTQQYHPSARMGEGARPGDLYSPMSSAPGDVGMGLRQTGPLPLPLPHHPPHPQRQTPTRQHTFDSYRTSPGASPLGSPSLEQYTPGRQTPPALRGSPPAGAGAGAGQYPPLPQQAENYHGGNRRQ